MSDSTECLRASVLRRVLFLTASALVGSALLSGSAFGASFDVNTTEDGSDAAFNGICDTDPVTAGEQCTLRAAITEANNTGAADEITFSVSGTHNLLLGPLQPVSNTNLTITGNGSGTTGNRTVIDGNFAGRVFHVIDTVAASLTLNNLRVQNGRTGDALGNCCFGAGIFSRAMQVTLDDVVVTNNTVAVSASGAGGAGISGGDLTITDSTISGNTVTSPGGVAAGIMAEGELSLLRSTVSGNAADETGTGRGAGILFANERSPMEIINSTISGNRAGAAGGGGGGGIRNAGGPLTIVNSTIAGNTANVGSAIQTFIGDPAKVVTLENTIVMGSTASNCVQEAGGGSFAATNSIDNGTSCGFGNSNGNKSSTDPDLGPLAANGGPTQTHLPASDSPAVDAGSTDCGSPPGPAGEADNDQRGVARPQGPACDIGAVEVPYRTLTVVRGGDGSGTVTGSGIDCGSDCAQSFPDGTEVVLTAAAAPGSTFTGWSGCDSASGDQCTMTLGGDETVTANFDAPGFIVNTLAEGNDAAPNDGNCDSDSGTGGLQCTLRAAIQEANANGAGSDPITFSVTGQHTLTLGQLNITTAMTITGNGSSSSGTVVSGNNASRVVAINTGSFGPSVTVRSLRVTGGNAVDGFAGGGVNVSFSPATLDRVVITQNSTNNAGGGLAADGPVTLIDSAITNNTVTAGGGVGGGAIANEAIRVIRSTISGNAAGEADAGAGGGLYINNPRPDIEIVNSTISGNRVGTAGGGAIWSQSALEIVNSTIAGNTATGGTGGVHVTINAGPAQVTLENTIVAGNSAPNCGTVGTATLSAANSIDSGTSCGFGSVNGNLSSTNPDLGPLVDNGGPTQTRLPAPDGPAVNAGSSDCGSPPGPADEADNDQRGVTRPQGPACDIGAVEILHRTLAVSKAGGGSGTVTAPSADPIDCGSDCTGSHPDGASVTLTATPASGSRFDGWNGCDSTNGTQCTVTANGAEAVTATFALVPSSSIPPSTSPPPFDLAGALKKCKKKKSKAARKKCRRRARQQAGLAG